MRGRISHSTSPLRSASAGAQWKDTSRSCSAGHTYSYRPAGTYPCALRWRRAAFGNACSYACGHRGGE
eukprot:243779-Chlamydomonas_euryale.AAC.1